jgi:hypothetical protein
MTLTFIQPAEQDFTDTRPADIRPPRQPPTFCHTGAPKALPIASSAPSQVRITEARNDIYSTRRKSINAPGRVTQIHSTLAKKNPATLHPKGPNKSIHL